MGVFSPLSTLVWLAGATPDALLVLKEDQGQIRREEKFSPSHHRWHLWHRGLGWLRRRALCDGGTVAMATLGDT